MSFEYFQELSNDLEKLLTTEKGYDVIIYVGENENIKEFHAHSSILCTRSQYFCSAFSNEWANKKDEKFIFKKPNISPELFKIILRYIYCGKIDLTKLQGPEVLKLLIVVDELNIQSLISCIQKYLIKNEDKLKLLQQNPIEILETVYQHESFTDLWNYFLEKICEDPETLFNSNKFTNLKAPLLKLLLNRDDLDLEEIIIWDNLLKWGLAQNPSISQDLTKWSKEDIIIMERSLHGFVPLVRFYHISSDDFIEKVYPLKKLLPEDLVDDLVKFHITPNKKLTNDKIGLPRQSKFIYDSTLIERQHFAILASWIDKKENLHYNVRNIPYNFNLLYRASRDGNAPAKFHAKCDNKGATIIVAKIENSEQIVGGYNPLYWNLSSCNMSTFDSFIYFFADVKNIVTAKVSYSNGNEYSIFNRLNYGPIFGGGYDLVYCGDGIMCCYRGSQSSYSEIDGMPYEKSLCDFC
ncbi:hypothetical protein GLOIN_2v1762218 [Rhizophagus irregularis DAOM 181602=DAOM 197198]|uniref:Btb/poz domain-containing protein 19-like n=3 Tax=Rhizophagus irregularis TaxID=588596 RepID=A0A015LI91_RHIIW|nr:hypothetical protein GLOIN_2v1762218 [Rhizophagus irregularis DAOM 181602=DAOM 197198]EXX72381.1 hypothetical protein RirG_069830 [Rhizophagus irregularis DAOM 197198w]POG82411.1 hypothetical protein GLOIN_2v1762218 [Rhizophagus irregularis DAOM 181602=DAOM 197198]|eukprot:XP_025189277.1 hypothetical protein GLOIN_2v1762218 [Rhizophagus irregularis DAOM 181602=DAOM 197198]